MSEAVVLSPCVGCGQPSATPVCDACRETLDEAALAFDAMPHGRKMMGLSSPEIFPEPYLIEARPKPLRLRLELDSHGPAWLSLLALCGYLVGVVPAELVTGKPA